MLYQDLADCLYRLCTGATVPSADYSEMRTVLKGKLSNFEAEIDRALIASQLQCAETSRTALVTSKAAVMVQLLISCKVSSHCLSSFTDYNITHGLR